MPDPSAIRWLRALLPLLLGLFMVVASPAVRAEITTLTAPRPVVWKDFLGVNAHFLWFEPGQYRQQMEKLELLGLEWVRIDVHWDRHEPSKGQYRLDELDRLVGDLHAHRLKSVLYLVGSAPHASVVPRFFPHSDQYPPRDPKLFSAFMVKLAQRYPSVDAWQVWNEPNLPSFWRPLPNPKGYLQLLRQTAVELQKAAYGKPVVAGGMAYYSQMPQGGLMLEKLGQIGMLDLDMIIAYHPYSLHPEGDVPREQDFILRTQWVNKTLRAYKVPGIWATEWGWSSYPGPQEEQPVIGTEGQADYVLRRLALMSALDFDRIFLFALSDLDDRATVRDRSYGLLTRSGTPKPVYHALKNFLDITGPRLLPTAPPLVHSAPDDLYSIAWQRDDGKRIWLFWSAKGGTPVLPGIYQAELYDPLESAAGTPIATKDGNGIRVQASSQLRMLVW